MTTALTGTDIWHRISCQEVALAHVCYLNPSEQITVLPFVYIFCFQAKSIHKVVT